MSREKQENGKACQNLKSNMSDKISMKSVKKKDSSASDKHNGSQLHNFHNILKNILGLYLFIQHSSTAQTKSNLRYCHTNE